LMWKRIFSRTNMENVMVWRRVVHHEYGRQSQVNLREVLWPWGIGCIHSSILRFFDYGKRIARQKIMVNFGMAVL
jgi:hypothetical protein